MADGENMIVLSTGATLTMPAGFYVPAEFVALLQTICTVKYNAGKLNWNLGARDSIDYNARHIRTNTEFCIHKHVHDTALSG